MDQALWSGGRGCCALDPSSQTRSVTEWQRCTPAPDPVRGVDSGPDPPLGPGPRAPIIVEPVPGPGPKGRVGTAPPVKPCSDGAILTENHRRSVRMDEPLQTSDAARPSGRAAAAEAASLDTEATDLADLRSLRIETPPLALQNQGHGPANARRCGGPDHEVRRALTDRRHGQNESDGSALTTLESGRPSLQFTNTSNIRSSSADVVSVASYVRAVSIRLSVSAQ
jgi:hypothetical protein